MPKKGSSHLQKFRRLRRQRSVDDGRGEEPRLFPVEFKLDPMAYAEHSSGDGEERKSSPMKRLSGSPLKMLTRGLAGIAMMPMTGREQPLRFRLRLLAQRPDQTWGVKEMRAVLTAGSETVPLDASRTELISMVNTLAETACARWAKEAEEAHDKAQARTKFRTLGAKHKPSDEEEATARDDDEDESDCTDDDVDDEEADVEPYISYSYRAAFRAKGARMGPTTNEEAQKIAPETRVPRCVQGTPFAEAFGRCLAPPTAVSL